MSFRIDDKVVVLNKSQRNLSANSDKGRQGKVANLKWNLVQVQFDDTNECDWIDGRLVTKPQGR